MRNVHHAAAAIAIRRSESLGTIVRNELERMILSGELKSGQRLNEQLLAKKLGVSRGPLREATRALERTGLLTAIVNQGVFVREISAEEAVELYDVRAAVFGLLAQRAARKASDAESDELKQLVETMDHAANKGDAVQYYRLNLQFHDSIATFARHKRGKQTYESLIKELHLFRRTGLTTSEGMIKSSAEHSDGAYAKNVKSVHFCPVGDTQDLRWIVMG
jgi:DNA-binding GntR family transcriptional regulator